MKAIYRGQIQMRRRIHEGIKVQIHESESASIITRDGLVGSSPIFLEVTNNSPHPLNWLSVDVITGIQKKGSDLLAQPYIEWHMKPHKFVMLGINKTQKVYIGEKSPTTTEQRYFATEIYRIYGEFLGCSPFMSNISRRLKPTDANGVYIESTCYVTTAAYGDPMHPMVCEFRWLRENILKKFTAGCRFISGYERKGPLLAQLVDKHEARKAASRVILTPLAQTVAIAHRVIDTSRKLSSFVYGPKQGD